MQAGLLKSIITIEKPVLTVDDYGSETLTWEVLKTTRASAKRESGNRVNSNNEIIHDYSVTFSIRFYHDIDESCRIIWNDKKYRILSIFPDRDIQRIVINAELINE